jgi:predicted TIM-barrel fold metal-dependent hydrolase
MEGIMVRQEEPVPWKTCSDFILECGSKHEPYKFSLAVLEKIRDIILAYGTDRVLFGTDYPMWPMEEEIEALLSLRLSEEDNRKILAENAEKVFGLK